MSLGSKLWSENIAIWKKVTRIAIIMWRMYKTIFTSLFNWVQKICRFFCETLYEIRSRKVRKSLKTRLENSSLDEKKNILKLEGDTVLLRFCWNCIFGFIRQIWQIFAPNYNCVWCAHVFLVFSCIKFRYKVYLRIFVAYQRNFTHSKFKFTKIVSHFSHCRNPKVSLSLSFVMSMSIITRKAISAIIIQDLSTTISRWSFTRLSSPIL